MIALVKRSALFDVHLSRQTQLQQLVRRQLSAPLAHRHDDAIDVFSLDDLVELLGHADHARIDQALAEQLGVSADKPDNAITGIRTVQHFTRDFDGEIAGTDDQNALAKIGMAQEPVNRNSPRNHQGKRERQCDQRDAATEHQGRERVKRERERDPRETERLDQTEHQLAPVVHHQKVVKIEKIESGETEETSNRGFQVSVL